MARARHSRMAIVSGIAAVIVVGAALIAGVPAGATVLPTGAAATRAVPNPTPSGGRQAPQITGHPPVVPPAATRPQPLPHKSGTVAVNRNLRITPGGMRSSGTVRGTGSASVGAALAPANAKVALRALVIAVDDL